jgi:DNA primase
VIPDETVERVRESADIVQVIGEHVNLRRVGTDWRGPCPFHQGTNRNFSVSPKKRMYYCFVCHEGGDVFNFLQKRLGMDWPSAVRLVAEKSGIEVREVDSRRDGPDSREPLWEVNATAAEYFQRMLWEDDLGQPARDYLAERRITREMADRHALRRLRRTRHRTRRAEVPQFRGVGRLLEGEAAVRPELGEARDPAR